MNTSSTSQNESDAPAVRRADLSARVPAGESTSALARIGISVLAAVSVGLLLAVDSVWDAGFVYAAVGVAVVAVAMAEFARLVHLTGAVVNRSLLVLGGVALFLLQWAGWASPDAFPDPWLSGSALVGLILMGVLSSRVLRAEIEGAVESVALTVAGLLYVPLLLGFLTAIRLRWGVAGLVTVLVVCKVGSSGGYVVGKTVGRTKLAPAVSPRKTVAGAVGAVLTTVAAAYALSFSPWAMMSSTTALLYGAIAAVVAMLGDLAASLLKRQAGIKDSGRLVPGLGGMLDMIDDVLFTAPVSYLFFVCLEHLS